MVYAGNNYKQSGQKGIHKFCVALQRTGIEKLPLLCEEGVRIWYFRTIDSAIDKFPSPQKSEKTLFSPRQVQHS